MYVYIYLYGEATPIILTLNHSMFVQMQRIWGKQKCTSTTLLIQNDFKWQLYQLFFTEILCFFVITQDVTVLYFTYHNSEFHIQWQQLHLSCTKELNLSPPGNSRIYRNTGYVYSGGALAVLHDAHNCESTQTDSGSCTQHSLRSDLHQKSKPSENYVAATSNWVRSCIWKSDEIRGIGITLCWSESVFRYV